MLSTECFVHSCVCIYNCSIVVQNPYMLHCIFCTSHTMYRVAPYTTKKNGKSDNRPNLTFWWGKQSSVHPFKADQINADAAFCAVRYLGVLDGVGGVSLLGMHPVAMALELGAKIPEELEKRLSLGASGYYKETYARLKSSVLPNVPGGLEVMVCQMLTH